MNVDITQIPFADFTPNSVLVIRVPAFGMQDRQIIDKLTQGLRDKVDKSVSVLIVQNDMSVELLPEKAMNAGGWYRMQTLAGQ